MDSLVLFRFDYFFLRLLELSLYVFLTFRRLIYAWDFRQYPMLREINGKHFKRMQCYVIYIMMSKES